MDELVRLMKELNTVLATRTEVAKQTEQLAREVLTLPKLPTLVADPKSDPRSTELLHNLQQRLKTQSIDHTENEALTCIQLIAEAVALVRNAINEVVSLTEQRSQAKAANFELEIEAAKTRYSDLQIQHQDQLLKLVRDLNVLQSLQSRINA